MLGRPPLPAALAVRDCSTCAISTFDGEKLYCAAEGIGDPGSRVQAWRDTFANLGSDGFIVRRSPMPCPHWIDGAAP